MRVLQIAVAALWLASCAGQCVGGCNWCLTTDGRCPSFPNLNLRRKQFRCASIGGEWCPDSTPEPSSAPTPAQTLAPDADPTAAPTLAPTLASGPDPDPTAAPTPAPTTAANVVRQFVGMVPSFELGTFVSTFIVKWFSIEFAAGVDDVEDVAVTLLTPTNAPADVAMWLDLDLSYVQMCTNPSGCTRLGSADTLRVYSSSSMYVDVDLNAALNTAFDATPNNPDAWLEVHHQLDVYKIGTRIVAQNVIYFTTGNDDALYCGLMLVDVADGAPVPTMDGDLYYSFPARLGTASTTFADSVYNIQLVGVYADDWHTNGVERFESANDGTLICFTTRSAAEAVLPRSTAVTARAQVYAGAAIVQRFGTAPFSGPGGGEHRFGLDAGDAALTGVHNSFYTRSSETTDLLDLETLTLYVNSVAGSSAARVIEFALKPATQGEGTPTDEVFATTYVTALTTFFGTIGGGARPLGDCVYLVAPGITVQFMSVVECKSTNRKDLDAGVSAFYYDPFLYFTDAST
ncbi:hypothetical protein M885DRAFT_569661 [Pelagophyceae sp. CCMP2097]|nr:hypothetical protein M885DRAFT_569661 [Pelagophyceae sp. CCMP2097]